MSKKPFVFICVDSDCKKKGSKELCKLVKSNRTHKLIKTECMDACKKAPNIIMNEALISNVTEEQLKKLL